MPASRSSKVGSVVVDSMLIVTPIVGFCNCSIFCCALLYVHSSFCNHLVEEERESWLFYSVCLPGVS